MFLFVPAVSSTWDVGWVALVAHRSTLPHTATRVLHRPNGHTLLLQPHRHTLPQPLPHGHTLPHTVAPTATWAHTATHCQTLPHTATGPLTGHMAGEPLQQTPNRKFHQVSGGCPPSPCWPHMTMPPNPNGWQEHTSMHNTYLTSLVPLHYWDKHELIPLSPGSTQALPRALAAIQALWPASEPGHVIQDMALPCLVRSPAQAVLLDDQADAARSFATSLANRHKRPREETQVQPTWHSCFRRLISLCTTTHDREFTVRIERCSLSCNNPRSNHRIGNKHSNWEAKDPGLHTHIYPVDMTDVEMAVLDLPHRDPNQPNPLLNPPTAEQGESCLMLRSSRLPRQPFS